MSGNLFVIILFVLYLSSIRLDHLNSLLPAKMKSGGKRRSGNLSNNEKYSPETMASFVR